tara:strand:- start:526 stop:2526 length:2001 start_codon:yes stop_codon:yes gene_type:complete
MSDIPYSVRGGRTSTSVAGLTDTTITNLQNQQILKYDSASQKWVNAVDGGGGATISSLGDTLISNPQTNQSLVYNATVSPARWENQVTPFTQSDFTNAVSTDAAFIKHKPIISTTSSSTMVGMNTGVNKEGDLTAFGKGAGNTAANNHICIGAFSGNLGNTAAISIGYNTHATHAGSVVIHGKDLEGLSSSAVDAFYIDPLRTINALTETAGNMKINMYNTSTKEIFLTDNLLVPGKTKLNGTLEVSNGIGSVNQVLTSNNTGALTWTDKSQLSSNIYDLGGLTWSNVNNNELIRRVDATNADGAGMTLHDTSSPTSPQTTYYKDVSYFGRHGLLTIPFGVNRFQSSFVGYNQRIIPYAPILLSTTLVSGLYLHHLPNINDYNVRVGVNNQYPSQDFQVGTTLYVNDTNKRVGIGIADPTAQLEVDGSIQIDSAVEARLKFQYSGSSAHALSEITAEQDGNGGDLQFFTKVNNGNVTEKLRINNVGAIGLLGANYGTAGQVLTSNDAGSAVSWTTPTAPPPGAYGVFYVDGALTVSANTGQQVNNLVRDTRFPLTGMSILGKQTGNTAQTITVSGGAGNYLFTWTINAQQLSGNTNNIFELYQGGSRLNYNWYIFSGLENIVGSFMVNQTTASADYSFLATATGGGHYRLNGFNNQWTQISITKLF